MNVELETKAKLKGGSRGASVERFGGVGVLVSVGLHMGVAVSFLAGENPSGPPPAPSVVRFEVIEPEKPKPLPPPKPTETTATKASAPRPLARAVPERAPPAATTQAPAHQPLDLSGVTLTNEGGPGFGIDVGSAAPASTATAKARPPSSAPASTKPPRVEAPVVAAKDLSRHPSAPALEAQLRNHYPADARRRGVGGAAVVRARVDPDGRVRTCNVVSESEAGFGSACRSTVLGSSWSPPLDREGHPVATYVRYTCRFRVDG
jgi:protein TonB